MMIILIVKKTMRLGDNNMRTIKILILCSLLITCLSAQAVQITFVDSDINIFAGGTSEIYIELFSETEVDVSLNISIFPESEYFNLSYPQSVTILAGETKIIALCITTPISLSSSNFTIILSYICETQEKEVVDGDGGQQGTTTYFYIVQDDNDGIVYPIIAPPRIRKDGLLILPPSIDEDTPSNIFNFGTLFVFIFVFVIIVLYIIIRKKNNGEK